MGLREGWPSNQPEQPCVPALVPNPRCPPSSNMAALPCGHRGAAILDMPSPSRWATRGPVSRALHPPRHPSFYSKALTVIWGLAPASPQPLAPQRPGVDRATGHGLGPGLGRPCCQRPGHPPPSPTVAYATLAWDPVNRHSAELRPFLVNTQGVGVSLLPTSSHWPITPCPFVL